MFDYLEYIYNNHKYNSVIEKLNNNNLICLNNASSNIQKLLALQLFKKNKKNIILVYPNIYEASIAYEDLLELLDEDCIGFYPTEELVASELVASSDNYRLDRIKTIFNAINNVPQIVITTTEGLTRNVMSVERIKKSLIQLHIEDIYNRDTLIKDLYISGYKRKSLVETKGTFSIRGSVIDVFPINYDFPIRIDFFDDEIETIKTFDIATQRSISSLNQILIFPFYEIIYKDEEINNIIEKITSYQKNNEHIENIIQQITNRENIDQLYLFLQELNNYYRLLLSLQLDKQSMFLNSFQIKLHQYHYKLYFLVEHLFQLIVYTY